MASLLEKAKSVPTLEKTSGNLLKSGSYMQLPHEKGYSQGNDDKENIFIYSLIIPGRAAGNTGTGNAIYRITLPWPPSTNAIWRRVGNRTILSQAARDFRVAVRSAVAVARAKKQIPLRPLAGYVAVSLSLYPPDKRRRDIDNYTKAVLDALTKGGFWPDDSCVKAMHHAFYPPVHGGKVELTVECL